MSLPVLLLLALLLLAVWLLIRLRRGSASKTESAIPVSTSETSKFHAVSIKVPKTACAAAKALTGERFLSTEAPTLPLPGCDAPDCNCCFVHHKDRRSGKDRRSPFSPGGFGGGTGKFEQEQRKRGDRRKTDDEDFF